MKQIEQEEIEQELEAFNNLSVSDYLDELYNNLGNEKLVDQTLKGLFSLNK